MKRSLLVEDPSLLQLRTLAGYPERTSGEKPTTRARQAAIWQAMHRLEDFVNTQRAPGLTAIKLVQHGGTRLTDAGLALQKSAAEVLEALDRFKGSVTDIVKEPLEISVACYPAQAVLVCRCLNRLRASSDPISIAFYGVEDSYREDGGRELQELVRRGELDITLTRGGETTYGVTDTYLYSWRLLAVAPTGTWSTDSRQPIEARDLVNTPVLISPEGHHTNELLNSTGLSFDVRLTSSSVDALIALAASEYGVALVAGDAIPAAGAAVSRRILDIRPVIHDGIPLHGSTVAICRADTKEDSAVHRVIHAFIVQANRWAESQPELLFLQGGVLKGLGPW